MSSPLITALYAAPLAITMIGLSTHVTLLRAKTGISILDGGNIKLAERIRRHGNFNETVPFVLLLMLLAELGGVNHAWLHVSGVALCLGRILHMIGLRHDKAATFPRIAGGMLTTVSNLTMLINLVVLAIAK
jgi:uncharacterized protein